MILPLSAQEGDGYGFLNIANLIPGDTPCKISIGGEELVSDGLKAGTYTGWFMVKTGSKKIEIKRGELDPASGSMQFVEGLGNLVAIYLEPDPRVKPDGKPYPPKIRIKSFPTFDSKGYGLRFVSLCPGENRFQIGNLKLDPKQFDPVKIPSWSGRGFEISRNGSSIGRVTGSSESGAFYLLVGSDQNGFHSSVLVSSNAQEVPEYLKPDKKKPKPGSPVWKSPNPEP